MGQKDIRLYWHGGAEGTVNYGDTLSPHIVEMMAARRVCFANLARCDMVAIGSILDKAVRKTGKRKWVLNFDELRVWGTGSFGGGHLKNHSNLSCHSVRGPRTRDLMGLDADLPMGDPGLLVREWAEKQKPYYPLGIIPHVADWNNPYLKHLSECYPKSATIDLRDPDIKGIARKISSCELIISTSLHGIITADAYNIPNIWLRLSDNVHKADWKFTDYFQSVDRNIVEPFSPSQLPLDLTEIASCADPSMIDARINDLHRSFKTMNI